MCIDTDSTIPIYITSKTTSASTLDIKIEIDVDITIPIYIGINDISICIDMHARINMEINTKLYTDIA